MHNILAKAALATTISLLTPLCATAHVFYTGKDFGNYSPIVEKSMTISGFTVDTNAGWADGTDADFANAHHITFFRFTLDQAGPITISIAGDNAGPGLDLLPAFSIYSGLAHIAPAGPDYDTNTITQQYLQSLGGIPKEGAFRALTTWRMGNLQGTTFDDLSTFVYHAHFADGTSANFGPEPGINGDGVADGFVSGTFSLPAGDYSLVVGGADLPNETAGAFGVTVTVATVPEPGVAMALFGGLATLCGLRRRRA